MSFESRTITTTKKISGETRRGGGRVVQVSSTSEPRARQGGHFPDGADPPGHAHDSAAALIGVAGDDLDASVATSQHFEFTIA